jgi:hypothetical protein
VLAEQIVENLQAALESRNTPKGTKGAKAFVCFAHVRAFRVSNCRRRRTSRQGGIVMRWRSKDVLKRPEWSMQRALYKSMGYSDYDLERPLIGVANSWNRIVPGHYNLNLVSDYVQQGIRQAGGTPIEFGLIAACDGIAQGHDGMHYILPTRDLIANDIEMMIEAHRLDAVVLLGSCDKIVPAMLMAAARLDIPAIMVVGGPMEGGCEFDQRAADITSLTEGLGMLKAGRLMRGLISVWRTVQGQAVVHVLSSEPPIRCAVWPRPWGCVFREVRPPRRPMPSACVQRRSLADKSSNC